jgi:CHAT domain-containing protein
MCIPDYFSVIKEPMDLRTVETNLKNGVYKTTIQFANDIRKIWNNAFRYNEKESDVYAMSGDMSAFFEKQFTKVGNLSLQEFSKKKIKKLQKTSTATPFKDFDRLEGKSSNNKKTPKAHMETSWKQDLTMRIRKLPSDSIGHIASIVSKDPMYFGVDCSEGVEIDLNMLADKTLKDLDRYTRQQLTRIENSKNKKMKKEQELKQAVQPSQPYQMLQANNPYVSYNSNPLMNLPMQYTTSLTDAANFNPHTSGGMMMQQTQSLTQTESRPAAAGDNSDSSGESSFIDSTDEETDKHENNNAKEGGQQPKPQDTLSDLADFQAGIYF